MILRPAMVSFLGDLIRIRSYTGQEQAAVERTLVELKAVGCDDVWMDSAGNALGRIGSGSKRILYDAHLDTNEVSDEREWPHPPLEPVIENGSLFGLRRFGLQSRRGSHCLWSCNLEEAGAACGC
jgi:succinyl-diaminopimelate desuccinylase